MHRVLVVDDHMAIRKGIRSILRPWPEWQVIGEAANGEEAVHLAQDLRPDLILMDISMPIKDGLQATREIQVICPDIKVLLLTLHDSFEWVESALKAGARGYLLKSDTEVELVRALTIVAANDVYASPTLDPDRVRQILVRMAEATVKQ
jgi:DNA-binding NarL/FixJ family response regulator